MNKKEFKEFKKKIKAYKKSLKDNKERKGIPMLCEWQEDIEQMTDAEAGEFVEWCLNNYGKEEYEIKTESVKVRDLCIKAIKYWNECEADEE